MEAPRALRLQFRMGAIVAASVFAFWLAVRLEEQDYGGAVLPGLLLLGAALVEFVLAEVFVDRRFPSHTKRLLIRLDRALSKRQTGESMRAALDRCIGSFRGCRRESISATVHLQVEVFGESGTEPRLLQITGYTTPRLGGEPWRFTDVAIGVIGRCLRTGRVEYVNFRDPAEYQRRMVEEFGFSRKQANQRTTNARSYLAYPVREDQHVIAVLYFFSTEPQVFPSVADMDRVDQTGQEILAYLRVAEVL